ncbi:hypothetical protein Bca52824_023479 [Brassica carinata]|uniref:Uncharacterized protein n=1 Tax=Brassica carinata TaxID=52824 RepID=A0A8X8AVQ1_BRACI|nr:hypothetical protein Bca52824_023479 [Brassica carinata]
MGGTSRIRSGVNKDLHQDHVSLTFREEFRGCDFGKSGKRLENESSRSGYELEKASAICDSIAVKGLSSDYMDNEGVIGSLGFTMNGNTEYLKAIMGFRADMQYIRLARNWKWDWMWLCWFHEEVTCL